MEIYLDNSATTQICKAAADKIIYIVNNIYGNPSSLHNKGLDAQHEVEAARKTLAKALGTLDTEIYFTSGGTEANLKPAKSLKSRALKWYIYSPIYRVILPPNR